MLTLASGRRAAIRDLDASIAHLRGLAPAEREHRTPCEGWEVRHLAAHMAESTRSISRRLMEYIRQRTGQDNTLEAGRNENPEAQWSEILSRITTGRNQLARALAHLQEDDLDRTMGDAHSCRGIFNVAVLEFGLHRSDIEASLGKKGGVDIETVLAADFVYGQNLDRIAANTKPDGPGTESFALQLRGDDVIDRRLVWNGTAWSATPGKEPVTRIHGSDSAVVLFMMGRIDLNDSRLDVTGNRDIASRFKEFAPGP